MNVSECFFREPRLLLNESFSDMASVTNAVLTNPYFPTDEKVPSCRYRGTWIKKSPAGYEIVGWQRNTSRLQKLDVSLPTIVSITADSELRVTGIELDKKFAGSKGLLCHQKYLDSNIKETLIGKKIDDSFFKEIQTKKLHCFHLTEVLGGVSSSLSIMHENNMETFTEEEALDGYTDGYDYYMSGIQQQSHRSRHVKYSIKFPNALKLIAFNEQGTMSTRESITASFFIDDEEIFSQEISGDNEKRVCLKISAFTLRAVREVRNCFTKDSSNTFMCSNLFSSAFIGLFVQSAAMKIFYNNYNYVLHCLNGIQRYNNIPRCIGAVISPTDAAQYFPKFDVLEILQ